MNKLLKITLLCLTLLGAVLASNGQDNVNSRKQNVPGYFRFDASYIFGGQVYNEKITYNPGVGMQGVYGLQLKKRASLGVGLGFYGLEKERFVPFFLDLTGYKEKKNNSGYMNMKLGYSYGWHNDLSNYVDYEFKGGLLFEAGVGKTYSLADKYGLVFQLAYRHQFGQMSYDTFEGNHFNEDLNYEMVVFSVGLINRSFDE